MVNKGFNAPGNILNPTLKVIGQGPGFPFSFSGTGGVKGLTVANGVKLINASLLQILTTTPGDRFMNPEFGANLARLIFEPNDHLLRDLMYVYTVDAVRRWEKRINIQTVGFPMSTSDLENGILRMSLTYRIISTNQIGNFVFPFQRSGEPMSQVVTGSRTRGINNSPSRLKVIGTLA